MGSIENHIRNHDSLQNRYVGIGSYPHRVGTFLDRVSLNVVPGRGNALSTSDLKITSFLFLRGIHKVKKILRPIEGGRKWRERSSLMSHHAISSQNLGQAQDISIDTDHDATTIGFSTHVLVHELPDGIVEFTGGIYSTIAASPDEMFFELEEDRQEERRHTTRSMITHQISISIYQDKNKRITFLKLPSA